MDSNTPIIEIVAVHAWRQATSLATALEAGMPVGRLRQDVISLAAAVNLLRAFPEHIETFPLGGQVPDTVPQEWVRSQEPPAPTPASAAPSGRIARRPGPRKKSVPPAKTDGRSHTRPERRDAFICGGCDRPVSVTGHCGC